MHLDSSLCILNLDYHLLLSENCTGQVFRAGRLPEVRSRIGRYQISLLVMQQILNILEIMDQVNVNYIIDVHFFCNIKLSLLHKEVSYRIIRYQISLLEIATQLDSSHSFSGKLEVQHITKDVQW